MSFVWKDPKGRLKSPGLCAREIREVAHELGLDDFAAVLGTMAVAQESDFWCPWNRKDPQSHDFPFDSESDDGRSVAYLQQQNRNDDPADDADDWWGTMASRMDLKSSMREFLKRLQKNYRAAASDPAMASEFISNVQRPDPKFRGAYAKHWDRAWALVRGVADTEPPEVPPVTAPVDPMRPDFNEIDQIFMDDGNHFSVRSRPPMNFFLHTQEGDGNATDLAAFLRSTSGNGAVSYHYTLHQDPKDGGVTVVDVGDTDLYSWSVLNANVFSINACFAGSRAAQTRDQWIKKYGKAIHVAAYLAVQDARKYKFSTEVIVPPYGTPRAGISDHRYVTEALNIGNHTDVGGPMNAPFTGFPWDLFIESVNHFTDNAPVVTQPVPTTPIPAGTWPKTASDRQLLEYMAEQLGPGHPDWKSKGMTLRDKVWALQALQSIPTVTP